METISFKLSDAEVAEINRRLAKAAVATSKHKYARDIVADHLAADHDARFAHEVAELHQSVVKLREDLATLTALLLTQTGTISDPEKAKAWARRNLLPF